MKKAYILLFVLFFISYGLSLFQIYPLWDDWTVNEMPYEVIKSQFVGNGFHTLGLSHFHSFLNYIFPNIFGVRILNYILFGLTAIFFYKILLNRFNVPKYIALISLALLLLSPLYSIKSFQVVLPYNLCLLFFVIACYLYGENKKLLSATLFFISFITNSLLFFFFPVFFLINKLKISLKDLPFYSLPFIFYVLKSLIIKPSGAYEMEGYNEISLGGLILNGPINSVKTLLIYPLNLLKYLYNLDLINFIFFIPIFAISFLFVRVISQKYSNEKSGIDTNYNILILLMISVILILSAIYPYAVVNKMPVNLFYESRHQLLMGFGVALFITSIYLYIKNHGSNTATVFVSFVIALFVFVNFVTQKAILANSQNQIAFFNKLAKANANDQSKIIYLKQNDVDLNDLYNWRLYEFGGYLKRNELPRNKILINKVTSGLVDSKRLKYFLDKHYNIDEFDTTNFEIDTVYQTVERGPYNVLF